MQAGRSVFVCQVRYDCKAPERRSLRQAVDLKKGDYFNIELICIMAWEGEVGRHTGSQWLLGPRDGRAQLRCWRWVWGPGKDSLGARRTG